MTEITHEQIQVNGISLHVATSGPVDGPPVVLCHGFPELWYSWRHQLTALANAGHRVFAPDLRGYGQSSHPKGDVADYGSDRLTADLCGLLDHHGYQRAAFVGHDWGAILLWEMGRLHPQRVSSLYNMSVPLMTPPAPPTEVFKAIFADHFFYILYFQPVGPAEAELEADPHLFVRNILYSLGAEGMAERPWESPALREPTGLLDTLRDAPEQLPAWITENDVNVYSDAFAKSGFFGPLSYYRNFDANWERSKGIPASVFAMPVGFLIGGVDPVKLITPGAAEAMASLLPDFRGITTIEGAGHWVQQERPDETNAALLEFLSSLN